MVDRGPTTVTQCFSVNLIADIEKIELEIGLFSKSYFRQKDVAKTHKGDAFAKLQWTVDCNHRQGCLDSPAISFHNGDGKPDVATSDERYPGNALNACLTWYEQGGDPAKAGWEKHIIVYVGHKGYPRILYLKQVQPDDKADLFSYMGNTQGSIQQIT